MATIEAWYKSQIPDVQKQLKIVKDAQFLHISQFPNIKVMTPRIGHRQMSKEDRTIPRICGCETVAGCIYGHSAVRDYVFGQMTHDGNDFVEFDGITFYIYRINVEACVKPSNRLVPDSSKTKELWVVPYSPEAMSVTPQRVGRLIPYYFSAAIDAGKRVETNVFMLEANVAMQLDDKTSVDIGYYKFEIDGALSIEHDGKVNNVTKLTAIPKAEFDMAAKLVRMNLRKIK